jgi:hypothetical protein
VREGEGCLLLNRSLGGIGKLYQDDALLGEVYYNIKQEQPPGRFVCTTVFVGNEIDLTANASDTLYRLFLENNHDILVTLCKARPAPHAPYSGVVRDGKLHSELDLTHAHLAGS